MKRLREILIDILPFLFSAAERFWDNLPEKSKQALLEGGQFAQILKECYDKGYDAFVARVAAELNMDTAKIDELLLSLAKKLNIDVDAPNELFDKLQAMVDKGMEDSTWDNLWHSVSGQLQLILAGGRVNWGQLAMGIVQFVYDKFIKPKRK